MKRLFNNFRLKSLTTGFGTDQILFFLILGAAVLWKVVLLVYQTIPFNSDEAVVALMAKHILQGERPVFFYGQAYMGSLDAWLVALGFAIFGSHVWVIRLVQSGLYIGTMILTYLVGKTVFKNHIAGLMAMGMLAIPTVNVTLYTTASLGGYGEALLLGCFNLWITCLVYRGTEQSRKNTWRFFLWGLSAGLGLWANALSMVFVIPCLVLLTIRFIKLNDPKKWIESGLGILGGVLGSSPWWIYALSKGIGPLVSELTGSAVSVQAGNYFAKVGSHLFNLILLGVPVILGLRPPWSVEWLALPLIPLALCFWGIVGYFIFRQIRRGVPEKWFLLLCVGISATLFAAFLFTSFGIDPSGRYFIPLVVPMTLMAGTFLTAQEKPKWLKWILFALIVVFQAWGTIQCVGKNSPGLTTQFYAPTIIDHRYDGQLIEFLKANGEDRGYTTYWVSYPLAFLSDENLIFIPRLPYHDDFRYTVRDDRYAPYTEEVAGSDHAAYITAGSPWLDEYLRYHFSQLGVQWKEQSIGDFRVFYRISRKVTPQAIGLGDSTNP